jgi:alpha-tubulin suppressor-like RCC1 family protein/uncharacterized protein YjdB
VRRTAALLLAAGVAACAGEPVAPTSLVPVASVSLLPSGPVVGVGARAPLTAVTLSAQGDTLPRRRLAWSSADPAIATVDSVGVVTGVAAGTTTITAEVDGRSATLPLAVSPVPVASVVIAPPALNLTTEEAGQLTGTARDAGGATLAGRVFAWTSSTPGVASVSPTGRVTAVAAGTATITGTSEGSSGTATVTVTLAPVASITITPASGAVGLGDSLALVATPRDAGGAPLTGRTIAWTSSDTLRATVDARGVVRGRSPGAVTITAATGGFKASAPVRVALRFTAVSAGRDFSCGVTPIHTVYCWGQNLGGSLGTGGPQSTTRPVRVLQTVAAGFDSVSAGADHACALSADGTIWCWGTNAFGQLGDGSTFNRAAPVPIAPPFGASFVQVRAAASFSCGLTTQGVAFCWGLNDSGQLGNASNFSFSTPNPLPLEVSGGPFTRLSATQGHVCATATTKVVLCWGSNATGQLGRGGGTDPGTFLALAITGSFQYSAIAAGVGFSCGVQVDGSGWCWGSNGFGELGTSTLTTTQTFPVAVASSAQFATVSAGSGLACAVDVRGAGYCWGSNAFGQLGIGRGEAAINPPGPRPLSPTLVFGDISAGWFHACGVTVDRVAYCWGRAHATGIVGASALGTGAETDSNVPLQVADQ